MMTNYALSVVLPTYNEAGNIVRLITKILAACKRQKLTCEVIVVDDNSPDQTGKIVQKKFVRNKNVHSFLRLNEKGLASAIWYGIKKARGKYILVMDTDFNHDPKEVSILYKLGQNYQLVIGSRYVKNGGMENRVRHWLSYFFNWYLRLLLAHGVHDNLSGFFIMKRKDLLRLPIGKIFYGFGDYFIRLIYKSHAAGYSIKETPVFYKNRTYGVSKSKFLSMFISYTLSVLKLRFGTI